jgi:hypothetical protein
MVKKIGIMSKAKAKAFVDSRGEPGRYWDGIDYMQYRMLTEPGPRLPKNWRPGDPLPSIPFKGLPRRTRTRKAAG